MGQITANESRRRHTLIALMAPLCEWDKDPAHLRDHQLCQIFFNVLVVEGVVIGMLWRTDESTDTGAIKILPIIFKGLVASAICLVVAIVCRAIFRVANKICHDNTNAETRRVGCKGVTALSIAWLFAFLVYAVCTWTIVAYARCYSSDDANGFLFDWSISLAISFAFTEPIFVLAIVALPCIFKNRFCEGCMENLQRMGIDPSMLA